MTTVTELLNKVKVRIDGDRSPMIDRLVGAISSTSTESLVVEFEAAGLTMGAIFEIDSEQFYCLGRTGTAVTALRGWNGTTAATHVDNSLVFVNPRWSTKELTDLLVEELRSWPVNMGQVVTNEVIFAVGALQAEVDPGAGRVIRRVLRSYLQSSPSRETSSRLPYDIQLIRDADNDELTTGWGLQLFVSFGEARTMQVDLLIDYDLSAITTGSTELETGVGLQAPMIDVLTYGMLWRAMSTKEIQRTSTTAQTAQTNEQVPPTHQLQAAAALKDIRDARLEDELARLYSTYPTLISTEAS